MLPHRIPRALAVLAVLAAAGCASSRGGGVASEPLTPELLGPLSREQIEAAVPDWVAAEVEASPDAEQALTLAAAGLPGSRVIVYLGTWCSDSRRELARLWRALDEAGGEASFEITYVGVDRDKRRPRALLAGAGLLYVPTFIVELGGVEVGRVIEESPNGIEFDLAALLGGEAAGVVTAREEL